MNLTFNGTTYDQARDSNRLSLQYQRTFECMADGQWRTLEQLATLVGAPTHSVSARLRDMRKPRFGSHLVDREHLGRGLYRYRLYVNNWSDLI